VEVRAQEVLSLPFKASDARVIYEAIGGSQFHTGPIRFKFKIDEPGSGSVSVKDVILWYRRTL